jgi:hypothetical protein
MNLDNIIGSLVINTTQNMVKNQVSKECVKFVLTIINLEINIYVCVCERNINQSTIANKSIPD